MKYLLGFIRLIVGGLFIFSGLVKANDPLGLSYKMNEFFEVWHTPGFIQFSLILSVLMIGFEIIAGVAVLIGAAFRIFSFLLVLLTAFFTFLTAYVYLTDKIKECGCFGDCIKISNAETFWKDVILLALVLLLFVYRKRVQPLFKGYLTAIILILTTFLAFGMQWWMLEHLPYHDCLPYKVGVNISEKTKPTGTKADKFDYKFVYEKDGQKKDYALDELSGIDSTWIFVERKEVLVEKGNMKDPEIKDFSISDENGNNQTEQILQTPGYTFLLFIRNPGKARVDNLNRIVDLMHRANELNIPFYVLSSSSKEATAAFRQKHLLDPAQYMTFDATASKTALRSDPGLMLIENGIIRGKWSFMDYPTDISLENGKLKLK